MLYVFEGIDNTHKSTTLNRVKELLEAENIPTIIYKEPTIKEPFQDFYNYLKNENLRTETLLFLFLANRDHAINQNTKYGLKYLLDRKDTIVLADRYWYYTYAYQETMLNENSKKAISIRDLLEQVNKLIQVPNPKQIFYFYPDTLREHLKQHKPTDKIEQKGIKFFDRVLTRYNIILDKEVFNNVPVQKFSTDINLIEKSTKIFESIMKDISC